MDIEIFDTTLRDGAQGAGISFSLRDKLAIAEVLDDLGVGWIEAGNPGSNKKDAAFFEAVKNLKLSRSKICAFGSTRKKGVKVKNDPQLQSLLSAETEYVVFFGKSSSMHVEKVLRTSLEENIDMIAETACFLRDEGRKVLFDAEHFFDGWTLNAAYALKTVQAAAANGAGHIVLCDTNGGSLPDRVAGIITRVKQAGFGGAEPVIGIHAHNDIGLAAACSIYAVKAGCTHVQGTLLGFGERCGNTPLAAIIPTLELKLGRACLPEGNLAGLSQCARQAADIANVKISGDMPYIGANAFSHKAGMHSDAVIKTNESFEHINPEIVGNKRRILMSEHGGRSAIAERLAALGIMGPGGIKKNSRSKKNTKLKNAELVAGILKNNPAEVNEISRTVKKLEAEGWQFEGADASFAILARKILGIYKSSFKITAYRVTSEHTELSSAACCYAWVKVLVDGKAEIAAAEGDGPVNALDAALRRSLSGFFPQLSGMRLSDYKVRVINGNDATAAKVRVLIESTDGESFWTTTGVSADIIDASRAALTDSIEYKLAGLL